MGEKIVINPLTRISGFLEIEVYIENNIIKDAKSSGMLFRGFEKMLEGRPPLDSIYYTQRICGICSTAHSISSASALEDALKVTANKNDSMIRDIIHGCEFLQNHLRHFYQYTFPDYVKGPQISPIYKGSGGDYRLPDKLNKRLSNHYIDSIKYSRLAHKMLAILAGKAPHNHGVFVGGVTVNMDASIFIEVKSILSSIKDFIENVMIDDVYIISRYYNDYFNNGKGYGNFMSYGVFDSYYNEPLVYVKPGVLIDNNRYSFDRDKITENIYHAWYRGDKVNIEPKEGYVESDVHKEEGYSFVKAPRYDGLPMEVGPLARLWLNGEYNRGVSTMDRTIARALEAKKICYIIEDLLQKIELKPTNQKRYEIPDNAYGIGLKDTTRGALGHWLSIKDKKIEKYTIITPTSWNVSPTDSNGLKGTIEKTLMGTYIEDVKNPVEIGRVVRSFDPCISCATHIISKKHPSVRIRVV
ncbi:nickel-dependent hydrogenase large subunit [Dethiothermospora halolimnae]|uniref:nickel-dependent hydrogenase large subunit n=1 Tax=Dethiothermospora halolimnae TaxID=3114390 RepID=UPI003CCC023F